MSCFYTKYKRINSKMRFVISYTTLNKYFYFISHILFSFALRLGACIVTEGYRVQCSILIPILRIENGIFILTITFSTQTPDKDYVTRKFTNVCVKSPQPLAFHSLKLNVVVIAARGGVKIVRRALYMEQVSLYAMAVKFNV